MATSLLEHETVNISLEDVVRARPIAASPVKQSRSTTAALAFLIGCVTLMMTGFAVILPELKCSEHPVLHRCLRVVQMTLPSGHQSWV